jgi:hypothetical protein
MGVDHVNRMPPELRADRPSGAAVAAKRPTRARARQAWGGAILIAIENAPASVADSTGASLKGCAIGRYSQTSSSSVVRSRWPGECCRGLENPVPSQSALIGVTLVMQFKVQDTAAFRAMQEMEAGHTRRTANPSNALSGP